MRRGAIGVQFYGQNNPALLRSFGADHGIVVNSVEPGSPAERAGLKMGDVIVSVDGKEIHTGDELVAIVADSEVGRKLKVDFLRDKKRMSAEVEVGDRNKIISGLRGGPAEENAPESGEASSGVLGVSVKNLTPDMAQELQNQLHLDTKQGVIVTDVQGTGFASDIGVQHGDIVLSLNHKPVATVEDFNRLQSQLKSGDDVLLLVARRSTARTFTTVFLADRLP